MKVRRLLLCLVLSVALTVTFIPSIAFAAGDGEETEVTDWGIECLEDSEFDLADGYPVMLEVEVWADDENGDSVDITGEVTYQWAKWNEDLRAYKDIPGETSDSLDVDETGQYTCTATYNGEQNRAEFTVVDSSGDDPWEEEIEKISLERPDGLFETEIESYPDFEEGDILKIWYQDEEGPVAYEYFYDEDEEEGYFVNEEDDEDVIYGDDLNWKLDGDWDDYEIGDTCTFIVAYNGATCTVEAVIIEEDDPDEEREVTGISLVHEGKYTTKMGVFDHPELKEGDILNVTYTDEEGEEETIAYTYSYDYYERMHYFQSEDDDYFYPEEELEWKGPKDVTGRNIGDTCTFSLFYGDEVYCEVEAEIIENPVKEISFVPVRPLQLVEELDGEYDEDDPQSFFKYYFPGFESGDSLTVTLNSENVKYVYDEEEEEFIDITGQHDSISEYDLSVDAEQKEEWKADEDHEFTMKYANTETKVPFKIIANPVKAVEFSADKQHVLYYSEVEEECYGDQPDFIDGDKITLTYMNGKKTTFVYYEDEGIFSNGSEELNWRWLVLDYDLEEIVPAIGNTIDMTAKYMGKESNQVQVKIVAVPVTKVELKPVDETHKVVAVGNNSEIYDEYSKQDFLLEGDQLIVTMNEKAKAYIWDSNEGEFISKDGEALNWEYLDFFLNEDADWTDPKKNGWKIQFSYMGVKSDWTKDGVITLISQEEDLQNRINEAITTLDAVMKLEPAQLTLDDSDVVYEAEDAYWLIAELSPEDLTKFNLTEYDLTAKFDKLYGENGLVDKIESLEKVEKAANMVKQKAAGDAVDLIKGLPAVDAITLSDAKAVQAAKAAYDALKDKAYVGKVYVEKLNAAVAKIQKLQAQATYNKQVAAAKALSVNGLKVKAKKGKKANVTWTANKKASGYVIQYSLKKNFKKGVKTVKINKATTKKKLVKKLKAKKTYYFRIAAVSKVKNPTTGKMETYQGKWSKAKKIKAKK